MSKEYTVNVQTNRTTKIQVDETKFTPEFNKEFEETFYDIIGDPLEYHVKLIASTYPDEWDEYNDFLEGYGNLMEEFGVKIISSDIDYETEIVNE